MLLGVAISTPAKAQRKAQFWVTPMLGTVYYVGDLKDHAMPSIPFLRPFYGAAVKFKYKQNFTVGLGYFRGSLAGADRWGVRNLRRDFRFKSTLDDINLMVKFNPFIKNTFLRINRPERNFYKPWLILGVGYFRYDPQVYSEQYGWASARALGTEGQFLQGNYPAPYSMWDWSIKYGLEFDVPLNARWTLQVYTFYNLTFTDYIDDVSEVYPDYDALLASPNGAVVASYSYRYDNGRIPPGGARRGNPRFDDGYVNTGVSISYLFWGDPGPRRGRVKHPSCPTW